MCVGFWSLTHPEYALVLCANRDEFLARATSTAHWHAFEAASAIPSPQDVNPIHPESPTDVPQGSVLSGRDLVAGGTWLGAHKHGRVGLLTNITEPLGIWPSSRGALIASFLLGEGSVASAGSLLEQQETAYAGFNMMLFAPTDVPGGSLEYEGRLVTNHTGGGKIRVRELESSECASGGVSNGVDGRGGNTYPKICEGVSALKQALQDAGTDEDKLISCLLELLTSQAHPPPRDSQGRAASISIAPIPGAPQYGTRVSTVVLVRRDGRARFIERDRWTLQPDGSARDGGATRGFRYSIK
ncbi:DUF833-domain-containing protein [Peniophora sp. CONT]|nr:DUF833-domain-containing protein [Peniophora sp. CONT]